MCMRAAIVPTCSSLDKDTSKPSPFLSMALQTYDIIVGAANSTAFAAELFPKQMSFSYV